MPPDKTPTAPDERRLSPEQKLESLISCVRQTAEAKGWHAYVAALDTQKWRYATVEVSRQAAATDVSASFEITNAEKIRVKYHATSFHSYGLPDLYDALLRELGSLPWLELKNPTGESNALTDSQLVERSLRRFHRAARQLKHRHNGREAIRINDEYDVQDFLHVLLRSLFDDIRTEEYCPSYAGGASRIDFLLKAEGIAIEVKLASPKLRDRHIGEQLAVDIQRYKAHPDCKTLICFVYDPDGEIRNPTGLESDLNGKHGNLLVKVIVVSPS